MDRISGCRYARYVDPDPALFQENERTAPVSDLRSYFNLGELSCDCGTTLANVTIAYETWGTLNEEKDNAILICHAISGDSHAVGWWERIVGPGRAIDSNRYFVIGSNALGGCQGSTGPASLAEDGKPYANRFPQVTVGDMVEAQYRLIQSFGISKLHAVAGGSMGGMQALEWSLRKPGKVKRVWMTASCAAHNALQIGYNETARQAILRDPKWCGGDYQFQEPPLDGLAVARMIGHLSYLSEASFERKFGRRLQPENDDQFQVESYLNYQGDKFTQRFDANSFLVLSRAIDRFERPSLEGSESSYLFTSFTSDTLYPSHQSHALHEMALQVGRPSKWEDIDLPFGHDAFLLDGEIQAACVRDFLACD